MNFLACRFHDQSRTNMTRILKQGQGWRLGWDPEAVTYQGLVGNDDWAIELTAAELQDFCRLLGQLSEQMALMTEQLMEGERITCEAESQFIWLAVEGEAEAYDLRFILQGWRRCEGYWPARAVSELRQAAQALSYRLTSEPPNA